MPSDAKNYCALSESKSALEVAHADYAALTEHAAWRVAKERTAIEVTGDDRVSFMHGMCSADIKSLKPGEGADSLLLTERAHVIAEFLVWARTDSLLLEVDRGAWAGTRAALEKFLVADDVELAECGNRALLELQGPHARDAIRALNSKAAELAPWHCLESAGLFIGANRRIGVPAFSIIGPAPQIAETAARLSAQDSSIREVGIGVFDTVRIEQGIARIGVDTNEKTLALEARLERAISFSKGCYVGQETIERATARGGIRRRLMGLRFEPPYVPETGARVLLGGKEVGSVGSVARSPRFGVIGLAILRESAWSAGAAVLIDGGQAASGAGVVSELPFK